MAFSLAHQHYGILSVKRTVAFAPLDDPGIPFHSVVVSANA